MEVVASVKQKGDPDKALELLKQRLKEAAKYECAVGFPVDDSGLGTPEPAYDGHASIIEVAISNNYGLDVPERPFMDLAQTLMEGTYGRVMRKLGPKILSGEAKIEKVLEVAGLEAETDVRDAIDNGGWLPNAPATIKAKGSSKPLIDTATMRNRTTHVVRVKR